MLKIYHVPGTRSFRVIWTCEELGIPYKVVPVDFSAEYRASPEWRKLNPVGKVPVMEEGGFTMFESGAMVQQLLDQHGEGRLEPVRGTSEYGRYLQWSWFAEATFARPLGEIVNHRRAFPGKTIPVVIEEMQGRAHLCAEALDGVLANGPYLLGPSFSAADIMMGYTLRIHQLLVEDPLPKNVAAYWTRLADRKAFRAAEASDRTT